MCDFIQSWFVFLSSYLKYVYISQVVWNFHQMWTQNVKSVVKTKEWVFIYDTHLARAIKIKNLYTIVIFKGKKLYSNGNTQRNNVWWPHLSDEQCRSFISLWYSLQFMHIRKYSKHSSVGSQCFVITYMTMSCTSIIFKYL